MILLHENIDPGISLVICKSGDDRRERRFKFSSEQIFKKCDGCWRDCTFIYCSSNGELALEFRTNTGEGDVSIDTWYSFDDFEDSASTKLLQ
ncbi:hypothetical protein [Selenihalanaerobacter shriftii]|uniref:Uncharacterized protein n=1 Tax=Selenihalanaerobacter shriftii TaxID=142842 RepID=A0A1T4JM61_9FIRM|nr:hypothetical protein [Selenihalanaerobacter shriftii]SJZ31254.1 hypothetical protein SAMN02745118_00190 [Selenihalanaerobacter shriftii]